MCTSTNAEDDRASSSGRGPEEMKSATMNRALYKAHSKPNFETLPNELRSRCRESGNKAASVANQMFADL